MSDETKSALSIVPEGFYDVLSILIPGLCFFYVIGALNIADLSFPFPTDLYHLFSCLLVSYVLGHLLYSASIYIVPRIACWLRPDPWRSFLETESQTSQEWATLFVFGDPPRNELVERVREKWNLPALPQNHYLYYELCRNYVHVKDKERASFIRKEQAYGELARSLTLASALTLIIIPCSTHSILEKVASAGLASLTLLVFFLRYLHARQINAAFVYFNFLVLRQQEVDAAAAPNQSMRSATVQPFRAHDNAASFQPSDSVNCEQGVIMKKSTFTLPTSDGLAVGVTQYLPSGEPKHPLVVFVPGLKGFINWGSFPYVCERLSREGFAVLSVDFSRNGVVGFESEITRIDLAEGDSVSRQVSECRDLLDAITARTVPNSDQIDEQNTYLFGHSLGGAVALLAAAQSPIIKGIVTWSAISRLNLWPSDVLEKWEREGHLNMPNARTGQDFFLGRDFLKDVREMAGTGILSAVRHLHLPFLIVQGDSDSSVPVDQARELLVAASNAKDPELCIIPGGDHNFGAVHPFKGTTPQIEQAIEKTLAWLRIQLSK